MSNRKAIKRRRQTGEDDDFSPSVVPQKKRSKSQTGFDNNVDSPQRGPSLGDGDAGVRRSSRTPKPKVFDDEETSVISRTPEVSSKSDDSSLIHKEESWSFYSSSSTNLQQTTSTSDASIYRKQRKMATYNDGHKRETRRSYQDYLKELETESAVSGKQTKEQVEGTGRAGHSSVGKMTKNNASKRKSDGNVTPKDPGVMMTPNDKGPLNTRVKKETPDEASPKVRSSSRTPVPKRVFSLLEEEENVEVKSRVSGSSVAESETADSSLTNLHVRSSSRGHVPKKTFPLLEKDSVDAKEFKQTTPEQTPSKTRTPKLGTKRRLSAGEERSQQNLQDLPKNAAATANEPSPKVRVSSRGQMPKRNFSLLEGDEGADETIGVVGLPEKVHVHAGYRSVSRNSAEDQRDCVTTEPKKRKSSNGQPISHKQKSSREGIKRASVSGGEVSDDKVFEGLEVDKTEIIKAQSSSKLTHKKKISSSVREENDQGSLSRRKSKPVKRKVTSAEQTPASRQSAGSVKVPVKLEPVSYSEPVETPKGAKAKTSNKKKQESVLSAKQSPSMSKDTTIKQESMDSKREAISLGDIAKKIADGTGTSADVSTSGLKGKRKGLTGKNKKGKDEKVKGKEKKSEKDLRNSGSESTEKEPIVLKLLLPQTEDSTKHKKHHHHRHHHHHHHKHKHSSGSHDDGSPKKSHHKKSVAKSSENNTEADESKKVEKKKKISIKFKGLSSKKIDLEMAADSPGLMQSAKLSEVENSEVKSTKPAKEKDKKKKKANKADLSSSQSDSEHVKLVIKKDKLPSGPKAAEKKTSGQPTTSKAESGDQKKKAAHSTGSTKGKGGATPKKGSKTPEVC